MSDEQKASHHSAANGPSYSDIPDSEDFERYGVWVKAGPEDVEEGDETAGAGEVPDFELDDLSEDEFAPSDADTLLTDEEEDALADLEADFSNLEETEDPGESDFDLGDFESTPAEAAGDTGAGDTDTGEESAEMPLELDGEVLSVETEQAVTGTDEGDSDDILSVDFDDEDIDAELEDLALDLGEETPGETATEEPAAEGEQEPEDIEELSLEVEEPEELAAPSSGVSEGSEGPEESVETEEGELDLESIPGDEPFEDFDFEEDEDVTEELPELSGEDEEEETPLPVVEDDEETIDAELASVLDEEESRDLESFDQQESDQHADEISDTEDVMATAGYSGEGEREESSVLVNIEKELLAIKNELNELKQELATLRSGGAPDRGASQEDSSEDMEVSLGTPAGEKGGFFEEEEDEDETIALTGDELDHILDTAEFTEQRGQPTEYDDLDLRLDDSLSPESGAPIEEITLEDMTGESALEELEPEEGEREEEGSDELEELDLDLEGEEEVGPPEEPETSPSGEAAETSPDEDLSVEFDNLTGSSDQGDVDALADLDVDSELADIEELSDEPTDAEEEPDTSEIDSIEIELPDEEQDEAGAGFAGGDTALEDFEAELGEPVLEIPEEDEDEAEELGDLDFDLEEEPDAEAATAPESEPTQHQQAGTGAPSTGSEAGELPENLKQEIRSVLSYMDQLLESLPEEKIQEFARSEHFEVYKRLFEELGLESE
jgi:pilus assembly protein FimV